MQPRFIQLAIGARRLVTRTPKHIASVSKGLTGRYQAGSELTQFSFRLAFAIDLAYVGIGALGGAAIGHAATVSSPRPAVEVAALCAADTMASPARLR